MWWNWTSCVAKIRPWYNILQYKKYVVFSPKVYKAMQHVQKILDVKYKRLSYFGTTEVTEHTHHLEQIFDYDHTKTKLVCFDLRKEQFIITENHICYSKQYICLFSRRRQNHYSHVGANKNKLWKQEALWRKTLHNMNL